MVAILLATFNGEKYIEELMESILNQRFRDFAIFIHDDGSTDRTVEIIDDYQKKYPTLIKVIKGRSFGNAKSNFLYLLSKVNADYYMFCDQDDVWMPEKVAVMHDVMIKREKENVSQLVFSDMKVVDSELNLIHSSFFRYSGLNTKRVKTNYLVLENIIPGCCCMMNSSLRREALKYKNIENIRWHDWWIALVASVTGNIVFVNSSLSYYRQHDNNAVGAIKSNSIHLFCNRIVKLLKRNSYKDTHAIICRQVKQLSELSCIDYDKNKYGEMIDQAHKYPELNKLERVLFLIKFNISRNHRMLWSYICA